MASPKHKFPFKGTVSELAERLNVTRQHLASILNGKTHAGGRLAFAIQEATHGRIKAKDLVQRTKETARLLDRA